MIATSAAATVFFLVLGQADGFQHSPGGLAIIPAPYTSDIECEAAGESAREANQGLSFLSYTCVPAEGPALRERPAGNYFTPRGVSLSNAVACDERCHGAKP